MVGIIGPNNLDNFGSKQIYLDRFTRRNLGLNINDKVRIKKVKPFAAKYITFVCQDRNIKIKNLKVLGDKLADYVVSEGDILSFKYQEKIIELIIVKVVPEKKSVKISKTTQFSFEDSKNY